MTSEERLALWYENIDQNCERYLEVHELSPEAIQAYRQVVDYFLTSNIEDFGNQFTIIIETDIGYAQTGVEVFYGIKAFLYDYKIFFWLEGRYNEHMYLVNPGPHDVRILYY